MAETERLHNTDLAGRLVENTQAVDDLADIAWYV